VAIRLMDGLCVQLCLCKEGEMDRNGKWRIRKLFSKPAVHRGNRGTLPDSRNHNWLGQCVIFFLRRSQPV